VGNEMTILSTFQPFKMGIVYAILCILCFVLAGFMIHHITEDNRSVIKGCSIITVFALFICIIVFFYLACNYTTSVLYTEVLIDPEIIPSEFNNYEFIERRGDIWVLRSEVHTE